MSGGFGVCSSSDPHCEDSLLHCTLISSWNPYLLFLILNNSTGLVWTFSLKKYVAAHTSRKQQRIFYFCTSIVPALFLFRYYFCSGFTSTARTSLEAISFLMSSMKLSKDFCPSSPLKRLRTDTTPSSSSFWPTTSIYGILFF